MSVTAGTPTVIINNFNVFEAIVPVTVAGSYPGTSAGDTLSLIGIVPSNSVPVYVDIQEQPAAGTLASGLLFRFAPGTTQANGALQVFQPSGTVSSTSTAPTITTVNDSGSPTHALGELTGALSANATAITGITGVQAPTITSTLTGAAANLGNVTYASVNVANLVARVVFKKFG